MRLLYNQSSSWTVYIAVLRAERMLEHGKMAITIYDAITEGVEVYQTPGPTVTFLDVPQSMGEERGPGLGRK